MPAAAYCGIAAVAVSVLALALWRRFLTRRKLAMGIAALLIGGGIAYVPWGYDQMRGMLPKRHHHRSCQPAALCCGDAIAQGGQRAKTTASISRRRRSSSAAIIPISRQSRSMCRRSKAFPRALAAAQQLGWTIVDSAAKSGRIEASESTRWFPFHR